MSRMNQELAEKYATSFGSKDYRGMRATLHADLKFNGPLMSASSADEFMGAVEQAAAGITDGVKIRGVFTSQEGAAVLYDWITSSPAGTIKLADFLRIEGGKIKSIETVYDPRAFLELMKRG